jgi:osmotically-inducible protein OsmY
MTSSRNETALVLCTCAAAIGAGLCGAPARTGAHNVSVPTAPQQNGAASPAPVTQEAGPTSDEEVRNRVQSALHADPYFYDAHVNVSVENGAVVLRGFVFSDWDLRNAIRIARKAAGDRKVIDNLTIKEGGRR